MGHKTDRFYNSKWGIFTHYLSVFEKCETGEDWERMVAKFDVKKVAKQLSYIGAKYYFITIMQGSRFMLAPNATYDRITGYAPGEACCKRDVIAELIEELDKYGIDLYLYYTGDGPHFDYQAGTAMGLYDSYEKITEMHNNTDYLIPVDETFVKNWTSVLEEYAVRYGSGVKGWWFDGMYDYIGYNQEYIDYFKRAVKKGNPDAIVAFNNGLKGKDEMNWGNGDFITGESVDFAHIPTGRFRNGAQNHKLITLGFNADSPDHDNMWGWRCKDMICTKEFLRAYIKKSNKNGAVITLDIWIDSDGSFDEKQMETLRYIDKDN